MLNKVLSAIIILFFIVALPLNIHTMVEPPYGLLFGITGDLLFILLTLIIIKLLLSKNTSVYQLLLVWGLGILIGIIFYFTTETIGLPMRYKESMNNTERILPTIQEQIDFKK